MAAFNAESVAREDPLVVFDDHVTQTVDVLLDAMETIGPFELERQRNSVRFVNGGPFAYARPGFSYLELKLIVPQPVRNVRVRDCTATSDGGYLATVDLQMPNDIDAELMQWLRAAYQRSLANEPEPAQADAGGHPEQLHS